MTALVRGVNRQEAVRPLELRRIGLVATVHGAVATTELTLEVHGTTDQAVEGRVAIPLPAGAVVTGYALDIGGQLVDGSLVEAARAQAAYEQNLRRQVDPGLGTVDVAGGFNTRVFPIDRVTGRTLKVRFTAPIGAPWRLPLGGVSAAGSWQVSVYGVEHGTVQLGGHALRTSGSALVLAGRGTLPGDLTITVAEHQTEALASVHATGEQTWQLSGILPAAAAVRTGGSLRIYWDRSRSRRDQDHAAELAKVKQAIDAFRPARIEWITFGSGAPERKVLTSAAELDGKVSAQTYLGATSYRALAGDGAANNCLLVSDGQITLDQEAAPAPACRLFAITPAIGANRARLTAMVQASGGRLIEAAEKTADFASPGVERVMDAAGTPLPFTLLPSTPGLWSLIAQAPASGAAHVTVGGVTVALQPIAAPIRFDGDAALLAASRLPLLEGMASRKQFVAMSRRYAIASPTLSFVVLEQPEDYVRNDIRPPANYPKLVKFEELQLADDANRNATKASRLAQVVKDWTDERTWYDKQFDLTWRPRLETQVKEGTLPPSTLAPAPAPLVAPPPPPPPPAPAAERDGDEPASDIVVTASRVPSLADVRVSVDAWSPDRDYLKAYDAAPADFNRLYAEWERKAGDVPAFYLDTADWLVRHQRTAEAPDVLLSALDLPTANQVTLGMVAARLERYGALNAAITLRERQMLLDVDHPQPRRLLALVLARRAALGGPTAKADFTRAIQLLLDVALKPLDPSWSGIDLVSLVEVNALLPKLRALGGDVAIDPRLVRNLQSDVRVVIDWSNDATDIDLWVDEPTGERVIYSNQRSHLGGHLSNDMTQGFGPEEYFIRRAARGAYVARANVFAPDRLDPNGAARVTAHLYRDWGRSNQREQIIDFDVSRGKDGELMIGTLTVERSGEK